jgi:hypothetical protein
MAKSQQSSTAGKSKAGDGRGSRGKQPYRTPTLTVYGSIRDMTGSVTGGRGDGLGMQTPSDVACKENAARVGQHPAGFGIYLFDYKPEFRDAFGHGRQFGVMAQEVEPIVPGAVSIGNDGYRRVDYARLGIVRH